MRGHRRGLAKLFESFFPSQIISQVLILGWRVSELGPGVWRRHIRSEVLEDSEPRLFEVFDAFDKMRLARFLLRALGEVAGVLLVSLPHVTSFAHLEGSLRRRAGWGPLATERLKVQIRYEVLLLLLMPGFHLPY